MAILSDRLHPHTIANGQVETMVSVIFTPHRLPPRKSPQNNRYKKTAESMNLSFQDLPSADFPFQQAVTENR